MMRVQWSRAAQTDLAAIDDYFRNLSAGVSERIGAAAIAAARFLARFPEAGPAVPRSDLRKWRVPQTPYLLLYRPSGNMLRIVRVVHFARDWTRFL